MRGSVHGDALSSTRSFLPPSLHHFSLVCDTKLISEQLLLILGGPAPWRGSAPAGVPAAGPGSNLEDQLPSFKYSCRKDERWTAKRSQEKPELCRDTQVDTGTDRGHAQL